MTEKKNPDTAHGHEKELGHDGHTHDDSHGHHEHGHDTHDHDHSHHDHDLKTVGVGIVTISTSRSLDDDPAGDAIAEAFEHAGHSVATRELIGDKFDGIQQTVDRLVGRDDVDIVVTTGGTGVTPDDVTIEAIAPLFEKELPGFGELFRQLSFGEIGTRVVGTRATGGIADGVPVFALPGSENAARLGAHEVIVPEVSHLAGLAARSEPDA
ncbi:MogA/MoaB family molybdenum cofactor biosynthesis protein [Haladaptatus sp. DJG-WS-42]|uniref:MogA/MoaB family molybdenum cofactor biosynthesis protein n=1 Tax=Haladaptatus sp. DJG-WS-42 TaxID=3120516 RepID=UPI0030D29A20